ncbi:MAG: phosphatase PAP2 family protein [Gammaproteobacteria bacterium]|nr:phosphatase PAP2 family protein [Gammaproteobacteria bacterium]MBU1442223.1 phosphatase PAP2 family protein [Gammaproteobacteria bacterium]MBU2409261.1 phosphatase PAP2 family protein [Gammaproteobacteria bacterium]
MIALPESFWSSITWFGDSAFLLPVALWIAMWLVVRSSTRTVAFAWCLLFVAGGGLVAISKIAFMGWGIGNAWLNFTGFSGHTTLSAAVWPVAFWLTASRWEHRVRVAAAVLGWLFAAMIGLSRLALYAHSKSEVASGFALGFAVSALFLWFQHSRAHPRLNWTLVLISLMTPAFFLQPGTKAPTQDILEVIAVRLAHNERAFTRGDLKEGTRPRPL